MSLVTPADEGSKENDILWNLVKNNEFLKYEHSIEQIKPSRFDFPDVTKQSDDDTNFSEFGIGVIKDYLHIGLVSEKSFNGQFKRNRILLLVWPSFVPPGSYQNYKEHLADLKKIKTLVFRLPEDVLRSYSEGNNTLREIVAAAAILTPVDDWKLLEKAVISSFYHLMFDKATSDLHGDFNVWQNYPVDSLSKGWKQMLFICCGPQGLASLVKQMLRRNWARIARISVSSDLEGEIVKIFFKQDGVVKFLEEINSIKPVLSTIEIADKANAGFAQYNSSSKKHRCIICSYETNYPWNFKYHIKLHTGETPYVCDICGNAYNCAVLVKRHKIREHTGDYPFHCKYCGKSFISCSSMKFHVTVHERKGNVNFQCYKCLHTANDETSLDQHMPTHSGDPTFGCTKCTRVFDSESALVAHLPNHSKDKPFKCHICEKGFLVKAKLRRHYTTHSDSRAMFSCQFCSKNLTSEDSLRKHIAIRHPE